MVQKANIDHGRYCLHYQFDAEEIEGAVLDGPFEDRDVCGDPSPEVALLVVNGSIQDFLHRRLRGTVPLTMLPVRFSPRILEAMQLHDFSIRTVVLGTAQFEDVIGVARIPPCPRSFQAHM